MRLAELKLAIIGLGYVGLPLAVEFGKKRLVAGYDISAKRINELRHALDSTMEVTSEELRQAKHLTFTTHQDELKTCTCFIITVPTPVDQHKQPNLSPLISASKFVSGILKRGDVVIYESTVYPGVTEEVCVPILEQNSGLTFNQDFYCGYSPERINPGDRVHRLKNVKKITAGSTPLVAELIDSLYGEIIVAGTHKAPSIKVAEAAKVIENTQRDINIALINELAIILNRLEIDTEAVLKAAESKWNFMPFRPGLVGGHCIGVDPYYLTNKAEAVGYHPQVILAGRRLNDSMGFYVASRLIKEMIKKSIQLENARVLLMGLTFKENCPDTRNTRVIDLINGLEEYSVKVDVFDPWASAEEAKQEYGIELITQAPTALYDAIVIAVAHDEFRKLGAQRIRSLGKPRHIIYDLKYVLKESESDIRL
ncbi:WecC UDP-N-acetyl-D-mannosaminuronate dehydrogenase [Burkholderiales bacterium]